jgi:predicted GNAT family acetyltransferase
LVDLTAHLDTWEGLKQEQRELNSKIGTLEMEIRDLMIEDDASLNIDHPKWKVTWEGKVEWDEGALMALREHYSPEEIKELKNKAKEPTFNKRKLAQLAKYGGDIGKIVSSAKGKSLPELRITSKQ